MGSLVHYSRVPPLPYIPRAMTESDVKDFICLCLRESFELCNGITWIWRSLEAGLLARVGIKYPLCTHVQESWNGSSSALTDDKNDYQLSCFVSCRKVDWQCQPWGYWTQNGAEWAILRGVDEIETASVAAIDSWWNCDVNVTQGDLNSNVFSS